jgi:hypothetical protein
MIDEVVVIADPDPLNMAVCTPGDPTARARIGGDVDPRMPAIALKESGYEEQRSRDDC